MKVKRMIRYIPFIFLMFFSIFYVLQESPFRKAEAHKVVVSQDPENAWGQAVEQNDTTDPLFEVLSQSSDELPCDDQWIWSLFVNEQGELEAYKYHSSDYGCNEMGLPLSVIRRDGLSALYSKNPRTKTEFREDTDGSR